MIGMSMEYRPSSLVKFAFTLVSHCLCISRLFTAYTFVLQADVLNQNMNHSIKKAAHHVSINHRLFP